MNDDRLMDRAAIALTALAAVAGFTFGHAISYTLKRRQLARAADQSDLATRVAKVELAVVALDAHAFPVPADAVSPPTIIVP
jgi:hypothetical protein